MTRQRAVEYGRILLRKLLGVVLPAIPFGLGVGYATGNYLAAFVTGLVMAGTLQIFSSLDQAFFHPRLKNLPLEWREFVEITFGIFYSILGAGSALFVCDRIFHLAIEGTTAWFFVLLAFGGFMLVHIADYALHFHRALKEKEIQQEQLRALAAQAELKALKAQINPHFLFNTLNTIAHLISADPAQAETVVERLAEVLRYTLTGSEREFVSLQEELAFVDTYLSIEEARFGERLQVRRAIAPEILDTPVPSLILQPLVENAVKHGRDEGGIANLSIEAQQTGDEVVIAIRDQGTGMPRQIPEGTGLRNVDERLRRTYGEGWELEIRDNAPKGTVVTVRIPV